jgi:hypothetical protein
VELPQGVSPLAVPGGEKAQFAEQFWEGRAQNSKQFGALALRRVAPQPGAVSETIEVNAAAPRIDVAKAKTPDGLTRNGHGAGGTPDKPDANKEEDRKLLETKLSPDLLAVYRCSVLHQATAAGGVCKPAAGAVRVKVELTAASAAMARKLVLAGFKVESGAGTTEMIGSILPAKLKQLAEIAEVKSLALAKGQQAE